MTQTIFNGVKAPSFAEQSRAMVLIFGSIISLRALRPEQLFTIYKRATGSASLAALEDMPADVQTVFEDMATDVEETVSNEPAGATADGLLASVAVETVLAVLGFSNCGK